MMKLDRRRNWFLFSSLIAAILFVGFSDRAQAQVPNKPSNTRLVSQVTKDRFGSKPLLSPENWTKLDTSVDRALAFISKQQQPDGSFPTHVAGQPAVTALCVMAFLSRGHLPNEGQYGKQISSAVEYVLSTQQGDGTLMLQPVSGRNAYFEGNYNHAISGIMLCEVYGMVASPQRDRVQAAIVKALRRSRLQQQMPKRNPKERGGWRYMKRYGVSDADLSITSWQLMFLRSARNAEFDVPKEWTDAALNYVRNSFDPATKGFLYGLQGEDRYSTRAMVGAGVVALALGGEHNTEMAREAGKWILRNDFARYNRGRHPEDKYHYSAFYCSQAMFQLGGDDWIQFFPGLLEVLSENQNDDGSWDVESNSNTNYGNVYSSAITVLALTPPYQLLPIYQR